MTPQTQQTTDLEGVLSAVIQLIQDAATLDDAAREDLLKRFVANPKETLPEVMALFDAEAKVADEAVADIDAIIPQTQAALAEEEQRSRQEFAGNAQAYDQELKQVVGDYKVTAVGVARKMDTAVEDASRSEEGKEVEQIRKSLKDEEA
jgi:hypothetical protein